MMWIAVVGACLAATVSVVATARAYVRLEAPPVGDWVVTTLARSEPCRKLDPATVERIAASTFVQRFGTGETIFAQGTVGDRMFVVGEGEVKLVVQSERGEEVELGRRSPPEFFGEFAMLDGQPRTASAVATRPASLIVLTRESLHQLLGEPQVVDVLLKALVDMVREADRKIAGQPPLDLMGKVAWEIVKQVQPEREVLSRSEIAERVGEPVQRVNLVLRSFANLGFLSVDNDSVVVSNLAALRERAGARHG